MEIKLNRLKMKNAKGVKAFEFTPEGKNTIIAGDNGTGKTSVMDAYLWCLFDMDSTGRKGAEAIKTTDKTDYVHFLDHEVEMELSVDGKPKVFKKMLQEKWTKPKGKPEQRYDGNISSYWIDDVPKQAKDYNQEVESLIPATLFKILTDPLYFSEQLPWKERLKMLVDIAGGVKNEEIIAHDEDLERLFSLLGDLSLDDFKLKLLSQVKKYNQEIEGIPTRIDEIERGIEDTSGEEWQSLDKRIELYKEQISKYDNQLSNIAEANKPILEAHRAVMDLENKKQGVIMSLAKDKNAQRIELSENLINATAEKRKIENDINTKEDGISFSAKKLSEMELQLERYREEFRDAQSVMSQLFARTFIPPSFEDMTCDKCGQELPEGDRLTIAENYRKAYDEKFAREKESLEKQKESITSSGKELKDKVNEIKGKIEADKLAIETLKNELEDKVVEIDSIQEKMQKFPLAMPVDFKSHPDVLAIDDEIGQQKLLTMSTPDSQAEEIKQKKTNAMSQIEKYNKMINQKEAAAKSKLRIKELEEDLKRISAQKIQVEGHLDLCDRYIVARTKAIEGKINSMFTQVGFKLFKEQVNGGVDETCEAVVGNTTFSKANTAAQINAGLDIINTISKYQNLYVPVFIDHLESNLHLIPITTQYIALQAVLSPLTVNILN